MDTARHRQYPAHFPVVARKCSFTGETTAVTFMGLTSESKDQRQLHANHAGRFGCWVNPV